MSHGKRRPVTDMSARSPKLEVSFLLNQTGQAMTNSSLDRSRNASQIYGAGKLHSKSRPHGGVHSSALRRHRCDQCPSSFAQSHDLVKHKRYVFPPTHSTAFTLYQFHRVLLNPHELTPSALIALTVTSIFLPIVNQGPYMTSCAPLCATNVPNVLERKVWLFVLRLSLMANCYIFQFSFATFTILILTPLFCPFTGMYNHKQGISQNIKNQFTSTRDHSHVQNVRLRLLLKTGCNGTCRLCISIRGRSCAKHVAVISSKLHNCASTIVRWRHRHPYVTNHETGARRGENTAKD